MCLEPPTQLVYKLLPRRHSAPGRLITMAVTSSQQAQRAAHSAMASPAWRELHSTLAQTVETMRAGAANLSIAAQLPAAHFPWRLPWLHPAEGASAQGSSATWDPSAVSGGSSDSPPPLAPVAPPAPPAPLGTLAQSMRRAHSSPAAPGSSALPEVHRPRGWDGAFLEDVARRSAALGSALAQSGGPPLSRSPPSSPNIDIAGLNAALSRCEDTEAAVHAVLAATPAGALSRSGLTKLISKQHKAGNWHKALTIFAVARARGYSMDLPVFNTALGACEAGGDPRRALEIFAMLKRSGVRPDAISFKAVVTTVARANDWSACAQILLDICKDRSQVEAVTCLSLIGVFTRQGSWRLAELAFLAFFRHTGRFGALEDLAAAGGDAARAVQAEPDALARAERDMSDALNLGGQSILTGGDNMPASAPVVALADAISAPMRSNSAPALRPVLFTQEAPITLGAAPRPEARPRTSPFTIYPPQQEARMPWSSLPENALNQRQAHGPGRGGERGAPSAAAVANTMPLDAAARKHELLPVEEDPMARVCCNALLRAYRGAEPLQWPRMIALVLGMSKSGTQMAPDIVSYNSMLSALVALGQVERAFELVATISREGLWPSAASHRTLLHGAAAACLHERVEQAWSGLVQAQGDVEISDVDAALPSLIQLGRWPEAWATYQSVTKPPLSLTPTATTLATLAEPLRSAPSAAEACTQLLADAQVARVALPQAALESLLTHLSNSSRWDDAVAFVRVALRREGPVVLPCLQHLAGLMQRAAAAHDRSGAPPSGHGLQNAYRQVLAMYRSATS